LSNVRSDTALRSRAFSTCSSLQALHLVEPDAAALAAPPAICDFSVTLIALKRDPEASRCGPSPILDCQSRLHPVVHAQLLHDLGHGVLYRLLA
jgi:hypothetical protein